MPTSTATCLFAHSPPSLDLSSPRQGLCCIPSGFLLTGQWSQWELSDSCLVNYSLINWKIPIWKKKSVFWMFLSLPCRWNRPSIHSVSLMSLYFKILPPLCRKLSEKRQGLQNKVPSPKPGKQEYHENLSQIHRYQHWDILPGHLYFSQGKLF